jgi:hypothetical protein
MARRGQWTFCRRQLLCYNWSKPPELCVFRFAIRNRTILERNYQGLGVRADRRPSDRRGSRHSRGISMRASILTAAVMAALWAGPAYAPILCPDPDTGVYGPEHCDLIEPFRAAPAHDRVRDLRSVRGGAG